jgi:hypothetical protein
LQLCAIALPVTKRRSDVPVFLLYAGILHAIGLALLLPMLITLPGPAGESTSSPAPTPEIAPIEVIVLPPPQALTDAGPEHTSALPSAPPAGVGTATQPAEPAKAEPSQAEPQSAGTPLKEEIEAAPEPKEAAPELKPQTAPATGATESPAAKPSGTEGAAADEPAKEDAPPKEAAPAKESTKTKEATSPARGRLSPRSLTSAAPNAAAPLG